MTKAISGLSAPAYRDNPHAHKFEKSCDKILARSEPRHGPLPQSQKPMPLTGFFQKRVPPAKKYPAFKAPPYHIDRSMKSVEKPPGLHANDTAAIRAPEPPQMETSHKTVKISGHKTMAPNLRTPALGTPVRLIPTEIPPLFINILEFCANGKYHHDLIFWVGKNRPRFPGDRSA